MGGATYPSRPELITARSANPSDWQFYGQCCHHFKFLDQGLI
jgi:hypothetical protein